jgi:hypothetical protein
MDGKERKPSPWAPITLPDESKNGEQETWKVPIWQKPVDVATLALHPDGPVDYLKRDGYLQKRAGTSRLRWNIRYFELKDSTLKWWRPDFKEMMKMPPVPKALRNETKPKPIRSLDLTKLKTVTKARCKFPYSTRILLTFHEDYSKYQLELRAERENIILEWYRACSRFAIECNEIVEERGPPEEETTATPGSQSDEEEGFDDVPPPAADDSEEDRRRPLAKSGGYSG